MTATFAATVDDGAPLLRSSLPSGSLVTHSPQTATGVPGKSRWSSSPAASK
jgi:hypothetical protein